MSLLVRISVFWVFDQDTDLHGLLQRLGRLLNLYIHVETRDILLYKKQTKKMKRTNVLLVITLTGSNGHVSSY